MRCAQLDDAWQDVATMVKRDGGGDEVVQYFNRK
jgi:hypothetical protein